MSSRASFDAPSDVCGTFYAARILGVSVGTVQGLVERGELQAWRTKGGHRRISVASLREYMDKHGTKGGLAVGDPYLRVLVVDDDPVLLELVRSSFEEWGLPIDCTTLTSALDAMLDISSLKPDLLISDLKMPLVDGFEFLRSIRNNPAHASTLFLVITSLTQEEVEARGGVPKNTPILRKPLDMAWLHGYVCALIGAKSIAPS